jgi:hypothetical protein|tara:strand:- start:847 stop:1194 length:348 start_codon:yes stop_codon:yes gene_type:complete
MLIIKKNSIGLEEGITAYHMEALMPIGNKHPILVNKQVVFLYKEEFEEVKRDPIVDSVRGKYLNRSEVGIRKYGTTLEDNKLTMTEWLVHLQEELMDASLYAEKLIKDIEDEKAI